jgi:chitodextrinase
MPDTTPPLAPNQPTLTSQSSPVNSVTFSWTQPYSPLDNDLASFNIYDDNVFIGTVNAATHSFTYSPVFAETTYKFRVRAVDSSGNISGYSPSLLWNFSGDVTAPASPSMDTITLTSPRTLTVSWSTVSGATRYRLYRNGTLIATLGNVSSYVDSPPASGTYSYAVSAGDNSGNWSMASGSISTSVSWDTEAPTIPGGPVISNRTSTTVDLTLASSTDDRALARYDVYDGSTLIGTATAATSYTATVADSVTYSFNVKAVDTSDNVSAASDTLTYTHDVTAPTAPGTPIVSNSTLSTVTLTWPASTDVVGVSAYSIYNGGSLMATSTSTSHVLSVVNGATYTLTVKAVDRAGNLSASSPSVTYAHDTTAPSAPGTPTASGPTSTSVVLSWTVATDNIGVLGYTIYDGVTAIGTSTTASYVPSVVEGSTYNFSVRSFDKAGNVSPSSGTLVYVHDSTAPTAPGAPVAVNPLATSVTLTWAPATDANTITTYRIYNAATLLGSSASTSYTATVSEGSAYAFNVKAVDSNGNVSLSSSSTAYIHDITAPTVPGTPVAAEVTASTINLSWTASTDVVALGGYNIYDGTTLLGNSTTATFTASVVNGTTYNFNVKAYDLKGNLSAVSGTLVYTHNTAAISPPGTPYVSARATGSVTISWPVAIGPNPISQYRVYNYGGLQTTVATNSYSTSISQGQQREFSVQAVDSLGAESAVSPVFAYRHDSVVPSKPLSAPTYNSSGPGWVRISGLSNMSDATVTQLQIFDGTTLLATLDWPVASSSYYYYGVTHGVTYNFNYRLLDYGGNTGPVSNSLVYVHDETAPTVPGTPTVASQSGNTFNLTWTASTDSVTSVAGYTVYTYNPLTGVYAQVATPATNTYAASVGSGSHTRYAVASRDIRGNISAPSGVLSIDRQPPGVVTGLTGSQPSTSSFAVSLSWVAPYTAVSYRIYRNGVLIATTPNTSYIDTEITVNGTYAYSVSAGDELGNWSSYIGVTSANTSVTVTVDTTPPNAPGTPVASNVKDTSVTLSWTPATDDTGVSYYRIYDGAILIDSSPSSPYVVTVVDGSTYQFNVTAVDTNGNVSSPSGTLTYLHDRTPPSTPGTPVAAGKTSSSVSLSWTASVDTGSGLAGYDIYNGNTLIGTSPTNTYEATLISGVDYTFTVKARDVAGNTSSSSGSLAVDNSAPATPEDLTVVHLSNSSRNVDVTWTMATFATQYRVYRDGVLIATLSDTEFIDTTLLIDGTYEYTVSAGDAAGNWSAQSPAEMVTVTTVLIPAVPNAPVLTPDPSGTSRTVDISWTAVSGADTYEIARNGVSIGTTSDLTFEDTPGADGTYTYTVRASNVAGDSAYSTGTSISIDRTPPGTPYQLTVTQPSPISRDVDVAWSGSGDAVEYRVYRDGVLLETTSSTSFTDDSLTADGEYEYSVSARDADGNWTDQSDPMSINVLLLLAPAKPATPTLTLSAPPSRDISVAFTVVSGAVEYDIARDGVVVGTVTESPYVVTGTVDGTHDFTVRGRNAAGDSPYSDAASIDVDRTPPAVPANVTATQPNPAVRRVTITWTASED